MFEETNVKKGKEPESQKIKIYEKHIKSPNSKVVKNHTCFLVSLLVVERFQVVGISVSRQTAHFISEEFANRRFLFGLIQALLVWNLNKCRLSSTLQFFKYVKTVTMFLSCLSYFSQSSHSAVVRAPRGPQSSLLVSF